MGAAGAAPELDSVPGADHFLFFSHREQVIARLLEWMRRHGATGP
jgi:pimeloyl-ACP methyl ester carboxylesterase